MGEEGGERPTYVGFFHLRPRFCRLSRISVKFRGGARTLAMGKWTWKTQACLPWGALAKTPILACSTRWTTASESCVVYIAFLMAGDPWSACSATTSNPRQATRAPRFDQINGAPRMEA